MTKRNQRDFLNRYIHNSYSYRWIRWASNRIRNAEKLLVYSMGVDVTAYHVKSKLYSSININNAEEILTGDGLVIKLAKIIGEIVQYDIFLLNIYPKGDLSGENNIIISRQRFWDEDRWQEEWKKEPDLPGRILVNKETARFLTDTDSNLGELIDVEKLRNHGSTKVPSEDSPFLYSRIPSDPFIFSICLIRFQEGPIADFNRIGFAKEDAQLVDDFELETYLNALQRKRLSDADAKTL